MLEHIDIANVLFLDIETVSGKASYDELDDSFKKLWAIKSKQILRQYDEELEEDTVRNLYPEKAGIFAEFGKIVCISVGIVVRDPSSKKLSVRLKSFASDGDRALAGVAEADGRLPALGRQNNRLAPALRRSRR